MADKFKNSFDKKWKKALTDKEIVPNERVWDGIEANLEKERATFFQRQSLRYKSIAAAAVLLLAAMVAYEVSQFGGDQIVEETQAFNQDNRKDAQESSKVENNDGAVQITDSGLESQGKNRTEVIFEEEPHGLTKNAATSPNKQNGSLASAKSLGNSGSESDQSSATSMFGDRNMVEVQPNTAHEQKNVVDTVVDTGVAMLNEGNQDKEIVSKNQSDQLNTTNTKEEWVALNEVEALGPVFFDSEKYDLLMPQILMFEKKKETFETDRLVAGLNFAPGAFNSNFGRNGSFDLASNADYTTAPLPPISVSSERTQPQYEAQTSIAYQIGVSIAVPLAKRWALQSGIDYSINNAETESFGKVYNGNPVYFGNVESTLASFDQNTVDYSTSVPINNTFEYLSVPVNMAYKVIDRKIDLAVFAGPVVDVFLKNEIKDQNTGLTSSTSFDSSFSPYRPLGFAGSAGLSLSYPLSDVVVVSFNPSFKKALHSYTNADADFSSHPTNYFLGFGLAYRVQ